MMNNHKEVFNLLDDISDLSSVDDLDLRQAPHNETKLLKKKPNRRKKLKSGRQTNIDYRSSSCSSWRCTQAVVFVVLIVGLAILSWVTLTLYRQVNDLASRCSPAGGSESIAEQLQLSQDRLSALEKYLKVYTMGPNGLDELHDNLTMAYMQINALNVTVSQLQRNITSRSAFSSLVDNPEDLVEGIGLVGSQVLTLQEDLMELQDAVKNSAQLKSDVETRFNLITSQLERLNSSYYNSESKPLTPALPRGYSGEELELLTEMLNLNLSIVERELMSMNTTLWGQIGEMGGDIGLNKVNLQQLSSDIGELKPQISILMAAANNSDAQHKEDSEFVLQLLDDIGNITDEVSLFKQQMSNSGVLKRDQLEPIVQEIIANVTRDTSDQLAVFESALNKLQTDVAVQGNNLTRLDAHITAMQSFLSTLTDIFSDDYDAMEAPPDDEPEDTDKTTSEH
ncbi:PREDICTED: uncharacterized protein LOC106821181 [Priapulus caudatus]|uniref:Uncharacterized protein LOC106821181 n=1 Tax=Priapulus caudatus TaxID=37621 RepID=A0ABM1FA92_PRICU|nr:PREDICTED: uncharacterized protein LOC106821181 [Priapulus caudatus]